MFEGITTFFKKVLRPGQTLDETSKNTAKERLHLVLMQDRANVSADFLDLMKQEIIEVIKKYVEVDEKEIDVRLTNQSNEDGTNGAPALYANIPIVNIKNDVKGEKMREKVQQEDKKEENVVDEKADKKEELAENSDKSNNKKEKKDEKSKKVEAVEKNKENKLEKTEESAETVQEKEQPTKDNKDVEED